ncbi:MAG: ABC transporter ATP-binding protein [Coriobacteriia bacterium]|nr:ABC transporter ATP-binding protein [Coriobacteriia bacterium]
MDVITTRGLTKFYGKTRGVESLSMSVPAGSVYGFLGPNGAGKTTTIRCLLGMLKPTAGEAEVLGEHVSLDGAALRRRIGYVAGEVNLYERQTGRWHLDYVAGFRGGRGVLEAELLERFDFDPGRKVKELSKGNKQKLALILGMAHDPELLILDEPTSGLDPLNQEAVYAVIDERVAAGRTVFLSSHVLSEVERVCSRVGIIRSGRLVAEEDVRSLLGKRLRDLTVTFARPVGPTLLDDVTGVDSVMVLGETQLTARVKGDAIDAVIKRLASVEISDLRISHASLEDVFLEFYRHTDADDAPRAVAGGGEA